MKPLPERLEPALAGRYRLERELGAGGMAIVWLAEDVKHRRRVAIKVLRPELAASLGPARFVREIEIAAQLQHPHILPLLDSGEADGLAYYVMPYVEGESLRDRLLREKALPLGEAVAIVREVADALAYAHRRGVVHRDVKPDNVMLADGHALVMDFGVAKAVSEARESMTTVGMAIGTPAYMAPEQAAGDPNVDFRADIYALGCLAYELLGGRPPFTGATPQQVLGAHISKAPEPLGTVRQGLPPVLEAAVMRCLAKAPDDRWPNAGEFRAALDTTPLGTTPVQTLAIPAPSQWYGHPLRTAAQYLVVAAAILGLTYLLVMQAGLPDWVLRGATALLVAGLPVLVATGLLERKRAVARSTGLFHASAETGLRRQLTWSRAATGGGVAFAVLLLAAGVYQALGARGIGPGASLTGSGKLSARDRIVVADFQNRTTDSTLGASLTEAFRIDLAQTTLVTVLNATQLQEGLARMGRAPGSFVDTATARELAVREGAKAYVVGDVSAVGRSFALAVRLMSADGGELVALRETAANDGELLAAVDRLSGRLRERMGESLRTIRAGESLEQVTTSSLEALRLFTEANRTFDREPEEAVRLLQAALAIDSGFAMAWRKLAAVYQNLGAPASLRHDAARRAFRFRDRLPPLERDQATAQYYWTVSYQPDSAERAFKAVLARRPDDVTALNNYGILLNRVRRFDEAEPLLRRALEIDSARGTFYINLAAALTGQGRVDEAKQVADALERRVPSAGDVVTVLRLEAYAATGAHDSARALAESALGRTTDPRRRADLAFVLGSLSAVGGRIAEAERWIARAEEEERGRGRPQSALEAALARAFYALEYRADTAMARRILAEARARYPLDSVPSVDRPYGWLSALAVELGDFDEVRRLAEAWRREVPAESRSDRSRIALAEDEIALRTGRASPAQVSRLLAAVDSSYCIQCNQLLAGGAFDLAGDSATALAMYERGVAYPGDGERIYEDGFALPRAYKRLGELYERRGNRPKALAYYSKFVELWRNADPELQPTVREVKRRMADLAGEPR